MCLMLAGAVAFSFVGCNLLPDDFQNDNAGCFLGWEVRGATVVRIEDACEGLPAVRLSDSENGFSFVHAKRRLVPGEKYRLSARVRASKLSGPDRVDLLLHAWPWDWEGRVSVPRDTAGAWQPICWEGVLPPSEGNAYDCMVYCNGGIGPQGMLELADVRLVALNENGEKGIDTLPNYVPYKARISPVEPELANLNRRAALIRFYYPGPVSEGGESYRLRASMGGRCVIADFDARHQAVVNFGSIDAGEHNLCVEVIGVTNRIVAANNYRVRTRPEVEGVTKGRMLNNFVTELFQEPLRNRDYEFVLGKDQWVYIGFDKGYVNVSAIIDGTIRNAIHWRLNEPSETMRFLKAGRHVVTVSGVDEGVETGTIVVRLVKTLMASAFDRLAHADYPTAGYFYDHEYFLKCGMYGVVNNQSVARRTQCDPRSQAVLREIAERGQIMLYEINRGHRDPLRNDLLKFMNMVLGDPSYVAGRPVIIDENGIAVDVLKKYNSTEVMWAASMSGSRVDACLEDGCNSLFDRPGVDIPELSAYVNVGFGSSLLSSEAYWRSPENEEDFRYTMDFIRHQLQGMRSLVPSSPSHYLYLLNGWMMPGNWTSWCHPYVDMKAFYSRVMSMLANDPEFADIGGIGFSTPCCDEDVFRFVFALMRHYCIEGRTEDFAECRGYELFSTKLRNGDFRAGFEGWNPCAAPGGSIRIGHIANLARKEQQRHFPGRVGVARMHHGDDFALFTRSSGKPNRLSQTVSGLKVGDYYQVTFATMDYDEVLKPGSVPLPETAPFSLAIRNAKLIPELTHVVGLRNKKRATMTTFAHRYVFRATETTAEVVFRDWLDEATPGGVAGGRQILNYIGCRPFYVRDADELAFLKSWTGGREGRKGAER